MDPRGVILASAARGLDTYRNFTLGQLFGLTSKIYVGDTFQYFFRDVLLADRTSCRTVTLTALNAGAGLEQLTFRRTDPDGTQSVSVVTLQPGSRGAAPFTLKVGGSWIATTQGTAVYVRGTAWCLTTNGRL